MKIFKLIAVLISLLLLSGAGLALDGLRLSEQSQDKLAFELAAKPEKVWALISDVEGMPAWWPEWKSAKLGKDESGREVAHVVNKHDMDVLYLSQVLTKGKQLQRSIHDPEQTLPYSETWTLELKALGKDKTQLSLSAEETVKNPLFRSLAQRLHWEKKLAERFGKALKAEIEAQNEK